TSQDSSPDVPNVPLYASGPIGPSGWGPIELGMSYEEVRKAGYLGENTAPPQGCTTYVLSTRDDQVNALTISESGVGRISAGNNGRTPEGVGSGTSKEELRNTYPDGTESDGVYRADTGAGTTYEFGVPDGAEVSGLALADGTCWGRGRSRPGLARRPTTLARGTPGTHRPDAGLEPPLRHARPRGLR